RYCDPKLHPAIWKPNNRSRIYCRHIDDRKSRIAQIEQRRIGGAADLNRIIASRIDIETDLPLIGASAGRIGSDGFDKDACFVQFNEDILRNIIVPADEIFETTLPCFTTIRK